MVDEVAVEYPGITLREQTPDVGYARRFRLVLRFAFALLLVGLAACDNPFAPRLEPELETPSSVLGDQRTIDGVFQNIRYAYNYRDTLIYGNLLARDFEFRYYNSDRGTDVTFNRDEEMRITSNLFKSSDQIDLQWNDILAEEGDSTSYTITRSYHLKLILQASEVFRVDGRATLRLVRATPNDPWMIRVWRDDSNF
jgi:hypothetical protein